MAPKTRCSVELRLVSMFGPGKDLNQTELPTIRQIIQYGIHLRQKAQIEDESSRKYLNNQLFSDIRDGVVKLWNKANYKFVTPIIISDQRITERIELIWNKANQYSHNSYSKKSTDKNKKYKEYTETLDLLFDLAACRDCPIQLCEEWEGCSGCAQEAHITCNCPKQKRLPSIELKFMRSMRQQRPPGNNIFKMFKSANNIVFVKG